MAPFSFNANNIRVVAIDGEPRFVAADSRNILGRARGGDEFGFLDADEVQKVRELSGTPLKGHGVMLVSESGLYKLIMRSDKPQAKPFQNWVTKVVLPAIRLPKYFSGRSGPSG